MSIKPYLINKLNGETTESLCGGCWQTCGIIVGRWDDWTCELWTVNSANLSDSVNRSDCCKMRTNNLWSSYLKSLVQWVRQIGFISVVSDFESMRWGTYYVFIDVPGQLFLYLHGICNVYNHINIHGKMYLCILKYYVDIIFLIGIWPVISLGDSSDKRNPHFIYL